MTDREERGRAPFRLNFEQQKKRAKDLQRALAAERPSAIARFRANHPKAPAIGSGAEGLRRVSLADAQLVIARELGLPSWPRLKAHIQSMDRERAAITGRDVAPDTELRTLHIRCGSDIRQTLTEAGFAGDFLEYSDPLCQGPVKDEPDFVTSRARFLTAAYGRYLGSSYSESVDRLRRAENRLATAAADYARVVLWLEHDSYDQLVLVRCLAHFAAHGAPRILDIVSINHFPGTARFIGLGQLPPEAIRLLWQKRRRAGPEQLDLGNRAWDALRSSDPTPLAAIARTGTPAFPDLAPALRRHLQELPSVDNGLSLTQRLALEIIAERSCTIGRIFSLLMSEHEPLPWLGDLMFLHIVEEMGRAAAPVFEVSADSRDEAWPRRRLTITETGRRILAGTQDWLALHPPERWVGGVQIRPGSPCWRWSDASGKPVMVR